MRRPGFLEGVAVALAASVFAGFGFAVLAAVLPAGVVIRGLVVALGLGYLAWLLVRSRERTGRVTTFAGWAIATAGLVGWNPPLLAWVAVQLAIVWLVRSLYFYVSPIAALADLAIVAFGFAAGLWALVETGSVFAATWCLFLVQALFAFVPEDLTARRRETRSGHAADECFDHAHRAAEAAVRRLSIVR